MNAHNATRKTLNPVIPLANYHEFLGPARFPILSEKSRMCVWSREGSGTITVEGTRYNLQPFHYLVVPWNHDLVYAVKGHHTWRIANVHFIPWHAPDVDLDWDVPHKDHIVAFRNDATCRQDREIEGLNEPRLFRLSREHPLIKLSDYIVRHFMSPGRNREMLQHCAWTLLGEIQNAIHAPAPLPATLRCMEAYIRQHINTPIRVGALASAIGRSPSQVHRLCLTHLKLSPGQWITQLKLEHACSLLRTSSRTIGEIARRTGFDDPFYFSRLFKKYMGVSPLKYRQTTPPLLA